LKVNNKIETANIYRSTKNAWIRFFKHDKWSFGDINTSTVKDFEAFCEGNKNMPNTIFLYLRTLKTIVNTAKLKGVVREGGSVTAGNASGVNDGAVAMLVASEKAAQAHGHKPRARVVAMATTGVEPRIMGIGPAPASEKVLAMTGLKMSQMDVIELNEAFAAQGLAVLRMLGIADNDPRVNPNGGAIALGHPLGASGARLVMTAVHQLEQTGGRYGLCTMCIGVGQGIALIVERV
jgi:acetyl-CoA acetyltransferase family protein